MAPTHALSRAAPAIALLAAVLAAGACSPAGSGPQARSRTGHVAGKPTDWLAYHADAARSGLADGLPRARGLEIAWARPLDGAVYGQPLVVGAVVVAATENDSVYGLDWATGRVRWRRHVGAPQPRAAQPCGNLDPLGITSTPVYDQATGLVYALAQVGNAEHLLVGLDPATGLVRYRRQVPSPDGVPSYDQQRGALATANGRIYVAFGGHFGDCGPYQGSVVAMPAFGDGPVASYLVPARKHGGIWAAGGPAVGPGGMVFVGVGNGAPSPPYDGTDSVLALSPGLRLVGLFAPASWAQDNRRDADLGSMTPALTRGGWLLSVGKSGTAYLLRAGRLGGIGGQVATLAVCQAFGAAAVAGSLVVVPCASGGPAAVSAVPGRLRVRWRGPAAADGSPAIGGGAVWVTATAAGVLYQLDPATGRVVHQIGLGSALPHFASPSLSGQLALIGTLQGVVAVAGA